MHIKLPYGADAQILEMPSGMDVEILESGAHTAHTSNTKAPCDEIVLAAMRSPIASPALCELARGKRTAAVICSDHTRPVPSRNIIPHILRELRLGNPEIKITLLIATGCHRAPTQAELCDKFGEEIARRETFAIHDCTDTANMRKIGTLPSGAPLTINRIAHETDLLLAEGFIEPHFFAGFSGGRKSVLPGICGRETVLGNHCASFIDHPNARTGVLEGNPIQKDMAAAVGLAKFAYIVNVIIDAQKRVVAAFAGDAHAAHAAGCNHLLGMCRVTPSRPGDIVITSNGGSPLDQNIYQAVKGMTAAQSAAAKNAMIIICAHCGDGTGGDDFYHMMRDCESPQNLLQTISRVAQKDTAPDQWQAQILARVLSCHEVILVCEPGAAKFAEKMKMRTAKNLEEAFAHALEIKGGGAKITVIPDGVSVIVA
jgi:nickel-dependent lactate racemase